VVVSFCRSEPIVQSTDTYFGTKYAHPIETVHNDYVTIDRIALIKTFIRTHLQNNIAATAKLRMLCAHATQHSNGVVLSHHGEILQSRAEIDAWDHSHSGVAELSMFQRPSSERGNGEELPRESQTAWPEHGAARLEISVEAIGFGLGIGFLRRKNVAEDGMATASGNADLSKGGSWPHHGNWGCALLDKVTIRFEITSFVIDGSSSV